MPTSRTVKDARGDMRLVVSLLQKEQAEEARELFEQYATDDSGKIRRAAGEAFGRVSQEQVEATLPFLLGLRQHPDDNMRWTVAAALGVLGVKHPDKVLPVLREIADDPSWSVRESVAMALITIIPRNPDFLPSVAEWTEDSRENVRRAVAESLGRGIGKKQPERVFPILQHLLADPSLYVRKAVANSCRNMSRKHPETVLAMLETWVEDERGNARWTTADAAQIVAREIPALSLPLLRRLAADSHQSVRTRARAALKEAIEAKPEEIRRILEAWKDDPKAEVREMAITALNST